MADHTNHKSVASSVFVGCIIIGTGIGLITNHTAIGAVIGVGVGFLAMAAIRSQGK